MADGSAAAALPRCVRLNNPGSIEHGDPWNGLTPDQPDATFCQFKAPEWGFRAMALCLITYQDRYKHNTIRAAITQWAPPTENDTAAYIDAVCKATKFSADEVLDFHQYSDAYPVIRAITIHEQGSFEKYFTKAQLDAGCVRAGLEGAPRGALGAAGRIVGTAAVGAGTYAASDPGALVGVYNTVKPIVDVAPSLLQKGFWIAVVGVAILLVVGEARKLRAK